LALDLDEPRRQFGARRAAAADGRHAVDDACAPAGTVEGCGERIGARADLRGRHAQHLLYGDGVLAASDRVLLERRFERRIRQLVDAQRAHERVATDAIQRVVASGDDARLRTAEQLVAAAADDVRAGGDAFGDDRLLQQRFREAGADTPTRATPVELLCAP